MSNTIKNRIEFENIYVAHYSRMKRFAQEYVIREEDAENIVQDVFLDLWEQNLLLLTHTNLFAYL
ncbi:MAG TPA: RNA polymerase sigma-70 factor, partial [Porphyromonadaceae bacterium]|nr:RNA polymerase sigma-70 factor [Porphyromonadaceae bacterium]